jgi:hypothetical protein
MTRRFTISELNILIQNKVGPKYVSPEGADLSISDTNTRTHQYIEYFNKHHKKEKNHDKHRDQAA